MRNSTVRLLLAAIMVMAVAACGTSAGGSGSSSTGTAPPPVQGGNLVVGTSSEIDGFNPMTSQWSGPAYQMARAVLDPLVVMDTNNHWQPYLAKSITPNADFTNWTFELRPGVKFHDGEVLDADALKTFFDAVIASPLSSQAFIEKPTITKTGDLTVDMTFTRPWSEMPVVLVDQPGYVIAPAQVQSGDTRHPIGTGPFVFDEWVPDNHFSATRNPDYWQSGYPYLDSIEFRPMPDVDSRLNALTAGDIDVAEAGSVGQPRLDQLSSQGYTVVDDVDITGTILLLMNNDKPPLNDKRIREAIVEGIDRNAFRNAILDSSFELATEPYPPESKWYADNNYPDYNPDHARQLVDEYEAENGPIKISIMIIATGAPTDPAQFLQQQLKQIGIDTEINDLEQVTFVQKFVSGDYDTVYVGGFFGAADPEGITTFLSSQNAAPETPIKLNFARYRNPVVDDAIAAQRTTDDDAAREAQWAKIWKAFGEDLPYAFLAHDRMAFVTKPSVYGFTGWTTPDGVPLPAINRWTPFYTAVFKT